PAREAQRQRRRRGPRSSDRRERRANSGDASLRSGRAELEAGARGDLHRRRGGGGDDRRTAVSSNRSVRFYRFRPAEKSSIFYSNPSLFFQSGLGGRPEGGLGLAIDHAFSPVLCVEVAIADERYTLLRSSAA